MTVSRSQEDLNSLLHECPTIEIIQPDLSDWEETRQVLAEKSPSNVSILVNNAGRMLGKSILGTTSEDFDS